MTELALASSYALQRVWRDRFASNWVRLAAVTAIAALAAVSPELRGLVAGAMSDAFLAVSVFVAATLWIVYGFERCFDADLGEAMARRQAWQPAIAAFLGATPGCGGAIVVVTQFVRGYASFGALISVLVATMGDAAFLLIAREPATAALVIGVSAVVGTISGMIVDRVHGRDFLMRERGGDGAIAGLLATPPATALRYLWTALIVPGMLIGGLLSFRVDEEAWFGPLGGTDFIVAFGVAGAALSLLMWAFSSSGNSQACAAPNLGMTDRVILDTNFVTAWVVMAFLAYELTVHIFGMEIGDLFRGWAAAMPAIGMLIGFVPGCGPQIVVTSLYLAGAIPLSAQFANAIANDGDALFPAIALAPRAAILATLYSAVPALILGYGWLFLFE
jgi:hypothetical protein